MKTFSIRSLLRNTFGLNTIRSLLTASLFATVGSDLQAKDYFITIGGGYVREQNQASMEANVLFFQKFIRERYSDKATLDLFFADGDDPKADVQIVAPKSSKSTPVTELLARLHRRGGNGMSVAYRNHQIENVLGPSQPALIEQAIRKLAGTVSPGDRVFVYVTAHGRAGNKKNPHDTSISCWANENISASQLATWMNSLPTDVPVVMVMAQCYAGGFANTIFNDLEARDSLAPHLRVGFFAQQYDLPAAGCRPDIEHDQEFSSYFWGALFGQSRNGEAIPNVDADGDGIVSLDEAFGHAVVDGETIDIPLKASDVLLRKFSKIPDHISYRNRMPRFAPRPRSNEDPNTAADEAKRTQDSADSGNESSDGEHRLDAETLLSMKGTIGDIVAHGRPVRKRIVRELCQRLGYSESDSVERLIEDGMKLGRNGRGIPGRPTGPNGRPNSGRRELLEQVSEKWPDLANPNEWLKSPLLENEKQSELLDQLKQLPAYSLFEQRMKEREEQAAVQERNELKAIKFRRLIETLELITLEHNLPKTASPDVCEHYRKLIAIESGTLYQP